MSNHQKVNSNVAIKSKINMGNSSELETSKTNIHRFPDEIKLNPSSHQFEMNMNKKIIQNQKLNLKIKSAMYTAKTPILNARHRMNENNQ